MILESRYESLLDGTLKYQFLTDDGYLIEACVIFFWEEAAPVVICVSSQIGCECACSFCVTGHKRFVRNLRAEEIEEQVGLIMRNNPDFQGHPFEITYMGTGEPLLNGENVLLSAKNFAQRYSQLVRINISSIFPQTEVSVEDLTAAELPFHFQYSLHFVTDELRAQYFRRKLLPVSAALDMLNQLSAKRKSEYCINYILFHGTNDRPEDANALVDLVRPLPAYLKISKYSPVPDCTLAVSPNFERFTAVLNAAGVRWKSFESKGVDIHAACGHLLSDIQF